MPPRRPRRPGTFALTCCHALLWGGLLLAVDVPAQTLRLTPPKPPGEPTKACRAARTKVLREQQLLDAARADLAATQKARATCASKTACARADDRIASLQRRLPRYEARLATYKGTEADACAPG
ncbi:MAG: hypothetical protein JSR18_04260 [Proteobacteria bacterium]|nr:hypothetical protein [Pseudomonadota bacterium]